VLSETIDYVRRDLRHPQGGFFSSEDADSEGVEGKFYVWSKDEFDAVTGDDAGEARSWWNVTSGGNFEGANILHRPVGAELIRPEGIERARRALFAAREQRVRPGLDDKVLAEWNGLFVSALAEAAAATGRDDWLADARTAGDFLLANLRRADGRWLRSWRALPAGAEGPGREGGGRAQHLAYAADHAALVDAFTRLAEATGEARWVAEAVTTADAMLELFWDDRNGGLFTTGSDAERLVTRSKDILDGATPSANGAAAVALQRLGALVGDDRYRQRAEAIVDLVSDPVRRHPAAFSHLLGAVELGSSPIVEVAVMGDRRDLVAAVQQRWLPNAVLAWGEPYPSPLFEGRREGLAYVCRNYSCQAPVDRVEELVAQLAA
jgi:uncharacterized protein YyaL (SSP411 family)